MPTKIKPDLNQFELYWPLDNYITPCYTPHIETRRWHFDNPILKGGQAGRRHSAGSRAVVGAIPTGLTIRYGCRLTVGHEALTLAIVVRIHTPVPDELQIADCWTPNLQSAIYNLQINRGDGSSTAERRTVNADTPGQHRPALPYDPVAEQNRRTAATRQTHVRIVSGSPLRRIARAGMGPAATRKPPRSGADVQFVYPPPVHLTTRCICLCFSLQSKLGFSERIEDWERG
jgi:hypothetical protein